MFFLHSLVSYKWTTLSRVRSPQPVVLHNGLRAPNGAVGGIRGLRAVLGQLGRKHVRRPLDGRLLAAVRVAGARFPAPSGGGSRETKKVFVLRVLNYNGIIVVEV